MAFNKEKADYTINFIQCLKLTDDFYGQQFLLQPWQKEMISEFYDTVKENGFRQYHYLYQEVPKKNGKSQLAAGLGLYHTFADGSYDGEVYVCAADKENASIVFNAALSMLKQSPYLMKRAKIKESQKTIIDKVTHTEFKVLSSEAYSKHGYKPTCVIFDELHAQPNRDLWDVMTFGSGSARKQPVYIVLTTAGDDPDRVSIGWEIHEKARKIYEARRGNTMYADNPTWLPFIYGLGGDAEKIKDIDIYDEKLWYECNPSLGVTIDIDTLRDEARDAESSPAMERLFRWLRLNQWISVKLVGWLPLDEWDATIRAKPDLKGKKCWAGGDLSATTDLTALTLTFPPQEGLPFWYQLYFPWITEEKMREREQRDGVPFSQWVKDGFVHVTPGRTIDYEWVAETILQLGTIYKIQWVGLDPWQAQFIEKILTDNGVKVAEIPQDVKNISPAMKKYEKLLLDRKLFHEDNPCARWNFGNVRLYTDANDNYKADKAENYISDEPNVNYNFAINMWYVKFNYKSKSYSLGLYTDLSTALDLRFIAYHHISIGDFLEWYNDHIRINQYNIMAFTFPLPCDSDIDINSMALPSEKPWGKTNIAKSTEDNPVGIVFNPTSNTYTAKIQRYNLGTYNSFEKALEVRKNAENHYYSGDWDVWYRELKNVLAKGKITYAALEKQPNNKYAVKRFYSKKLTRLGIYDETEALEVKALADSHIDKGDFDEWAADFYAEYRKKLQPCAYARIGVRTTKNGALRYSVERTYKRITIGLGHYVSIEEAEGIKALADSHIDIGDFDEWAEKFRAERKANKKQKSEISMPEVAFTAAYAVCKYLSSKYILLCYDTNGSEHTIVETSDVEEAYKTMDLANEHIEAGDFNAWFADYKN